VNRFGRPRDKWHGTANARESWRLQPARSRWRRNLIPVNDVVDVEARERDRLLQVNRKAFDVLEGIEVVDVQRDMASMADYLLSHALRSI
jgi:hypothetical protein